MTISRRDLVGQALALAAAPLLAPMRAFGEDADPLITSADQAVDVFDFERLARSKLPPAHFGYLATGVDGVISNDPRIFASGAESSAGGDLRTGESIQPH